MSGKAKAPVEASDEGQKSGAVETEANIVSVPTGLPLKQEGRVLRSRPSSVYEAHMDRDG